MHENIFPFASLVCEASVSFVIAYRANKYSNTAGISRFWSVFALFSVLFSLIWYSNSFILIFTALIKGIATIYIIFLQYFKFPKNSGKIKETKLTYVYSAFSFLILILVLMKKLSANDFSMFMDIFAVASQCHITRTSEKISILSWASPLLTMAASILKFVGSLIFAFNTNSGPEWGNLLISILYFVISIDFLFTYVNIFAKTHEPDLPF